MTIPDYQTIMHPLLALASDNQEHSHNEAVEALARQFGLSEEDRRELIPSGSEPKFDNRVGWARTYLKKAGLIDSTGRSKFRITQRGLEVLKTHTSRVDNIVLRQFPEFQEFQRRSHKRDASGVNVAQTSLESYTSNGQNVQPVLSPELIEVEELQQTPQETLEASYQLLRRNLAQELLERVKTSSPRFFERLVVDLLVAMGYGGSRKDAGQAIGKGGDEGIDGIIKEDRLGLDVVYIQAKRWEGTVGRPTVQAFAGSLEGQRARKGVLITTSQFSNEAKEYVNRIEKKIVLIDGEQLAQYMIDYGIAVAEVATYVVKKADGDYFGDD